ncbi:MFS transporter [Bacteroidetes/Chlorobi group bacterium MS-B_bin-24]|jgi:MFS family permease|nr:MAG: MFS transporter [Bacteroidetes/Chlorobi group bacterium MS-B_bin-24]
MVKKVFTRQIILLSLISFFTDVASEMLYPIIPIYLKSVGFSVLFIGILEGIAESIASLSKGYFGNLSDKIGKRLPFVRWGYTLSSIAKPMMGLLPYPITIFFARTLDRFGKGIRTSARDALLSDESTPENKGKVFGFHRAADTAGAVVGPIITLLILNTISIGYRNLFILSAIPGVVVILLCFVLKEKKRELQKSPEKSNFFVFITYLKKSPANYRLVVIPLLIFALINSSDFFLLLKVKEYGYSDSNVILFYILFNFSYALFSFPSGRIADKIGLKKVITFGLLIFSLVYVLINVSGSFAWLIFVFLLYGLFSSSTEGMIKALITNIVPSSETATALGTYNSLSSIGVLLSSSIVGLLWNFFGSTVALGFSGLVSFIIFFYFAFLLKLKEK